MANQIGGFGRQFDLLFSRKKRHFERSEKPLQAIDRASFRAKRETSAHKRLCVISSVAFNPTKIPPCGRNDELPFSRKKSHFERSEKPPQSIDRASF
jgi:hypothetical protein